MHHRSLAAVVTWLKHDRLSLASDRGGSIAVQFALILFPLLLLMGGAIDISMMYMSRERGQAAADAAALASARVAEAYLAANGTGTAQIAQATTLATTAMTNAYNANFASTHGASSTAPTLSLQVGTDGVTVIVSPNLTIPTSFLGLAGITSIPAGISATATVGGLQTFYQIVFVVDVSGSMSIGGTTADIQALQSNTYIQCAFACHDPNDYQGLQISSYCQSATGDYFCIIAGGNYCPWGPWGCSWTNSPYADKRTVAKNAGIKLKIDYVKDAINDFITQLTPSMTANPNDFKIGIDLVGTGFTVKLAPTTSVSQLTTAAAAIDVEAVGPVSGNYGYTRLTSGLQSALAALTNIGDGSSQTSRKTYIIFLTDGVEDVPGTIIYGRGADTTYTSACAAIKAAGVNMITVLAPYPAIPSDTQYLTLVAPVIPFVAPAMQTCANDSTDYFLATDGPGIKTAVSNVFGDIFGNAPLRISK